MTNNPQPSDTALTRSDIVERYRVSRTSLYRWIRHGQFPRQRKMGRRSFWSAAEVSAWFESLPRAPK